MRSEATIGHHVSIPIILIFVIFRKKGLFTGPGLPGARLAGETILAVVVFPKFYILRVAPRV